MKIKNLQVTSPSLDLDLMIHKPVCILRGQHSDLVLDLIRELIGDCGAKNDPDRIDDGHFVIHSDIEMDGKGYQVCYIRNADFIGDNRIAANFAPSSLEYSVDDTVEFIEKCDQRNRNAANIIENLSQEITTEEDDRPVFIYVNENEAVPFTLVDTLASNGRQVFVAVTPNDSEANGNPLLDVTTR